MADNTITFGCNLSVDNFWDLPDFARRAEDLGFDRVSIGEHVMDGNPPRPTVMGLPAMAAAAGATTRLRVLTGIVIAPLYHPVMLAKLVATVDQISGGRLDFGIGISGQRDTRAEFDALEIPVNTRGRRTDEMLRAMKQLWTEDHVSHHGRFFNYDDVTLEPKPHQQPYPPIWVAGRSDAAVRRAAIAGDGWYPYLFTVNRIRRSNTSVREMAEHAGRDLRSLPLGPEPTDGNRRGPRQGAGNGHRPRRPALRDSRKERGGHRAGRCASPETRRTASAQCRSGSTRECAISCSGSWPARPRTTSGRWSCSPGGCCRISSDVPPQP